MTDTFTFPKTLIMEFKLQRPLLSFSLNDMYAEQDTLVLATAHCFFKDAHREKVPSNKTPALTKNMNIDMWVVGISNQLFIKESYTKTKFSKK